MTTTPKPDYRAVVEIFGLMDNPRARLVLFGREELDYVIGDDRPDDEKMYWRVRDIVEFSESSALAVLSHSLPLDMLQKMDSLRIRNTEAEVEMGELAVFNPRALLPILPAEDMFDTIHQIIKAQIDAFERQIDDENEDPMGDMMGRNV